VKKTCIFIAVMLGLFALGTIQGHPPADFDRCGSPGYSGRLDKCTVIMVGKDASADGSVMSTHTCDCGLCDWTWRYVPAQDHPEGTMRRIYYFNQFKTRPPAEGLRWDQYEQDFTGLEIPQPSHTFGYLHGMFGYMNDNQVAIGESTVGCRKGMRNPTAKFDITALTMLAMERATTARHAVRIMGELAEKYGYGASDSGEMLAVSDPDEIWVFEVMPVGPLWSPKTGKPGAVWCAQRVPDDHVSVCPNESRIGEVRIHKKNWFMASENYRTFAEEKGFYDSGKDGPFNWKKAYSPSEYSAAGTNGSRGRMWRFYDLVAPSRNFDPATGNMDYPFSIRPDKKLSVQDVMNMTRDTFEGTPYSATRGMLGGPFQNPNHLPYGFTLKEQKFNTPRVIGVNRAEYVTVTQCRGWLPDHIGGITWIAFGAQTTSCFMPFYAGVTAIPDSFKIGDHWEFDRRSARWAFDYTDYHTQPLYSYAIEDVRKAQREWEGNAVQRTARIDQRALELYRQDPERAREYLTGYCVNNAKLVIDAWWELGDQLLVKYNHLWIYDVKNRKRERVVYPDWWLEELVRYNQLKPVEEEKK